MEQSRHNKPMPRDDYIRTLLVDLIIILGAIVIVLASLLVIATRAHASATCMTKAEARVAFPKAHLWWHDIRHHCWDNQPGHRVHYNGHPIAPDVLPVRAEVEPTGVDANGSELTPYDEVMEKPQPTDNCCWPPLDERSFKSRWDEFPAQWTVKQ